MANAQLPHIPQYIVNLKLSHVAKEYEMERLKLMINFINGNCKIIAISQETSKLIRLPIPYKDNHLVIKSTLFEDYYSILWVDNAQKDWKSFVNINQGLRYVVSLRKYLNRNNNPGVPDRAIIAGVEYIDSKRINRQFSNEIKPHKR